jgi:hypothetical protein
MASTFEIMDVFYLHNRGQFIFVRLLDGGSDFEVKDGALLDGIPIYNYVEMPRLLDENNQPRLDVFVFRPLKPLQEGAFVQGQKVELVIPKE